MYPKKALPFLILNILSELTDNDHYCSQKDLVAHLERRYDLTVDRKAVGSNIDLLISLGYDIDQDKYKGGYRLLSRDFDPTEVRFMVDALFSSKSISGKQAKALAEKLTSKLSKYEQKDYSYIYKSTDVNRSNNNEMFFIVDVISEAIKEKKLIQFQYLEYNEKGELYNRFENWYRKVSPYYLINSNGRYYLLGCMNKKKSPSIFRLDYMYDVKIYEEDENHKFTPMRKLDGDYEHFDISQFVNEHIYFYNTEVITALVELASPGEIKDIMDWFGKNATMVTMGEHPQYEIRCDEQALIYWVMQYGDKVKVLSPASMIEKIKKILDKMQKDYE